MFLRYFLIPVLSPINKAILLTDLRKLPDGHQYLYILSSFLRYRQGHLPTSHYPPTYKRLPFVPRRQSINDRHHVLLDKQPIPPKRITLSFFLSSSFFYSICSSL